MEHNIRFTCVPCNEYMALHSKNMKCIVRVVQQHMVLCYSRAALHFNADMSFVLMMFTVL